MLTDSFSHNNSDATFQILFEKYRNRLYGYVLTITHSQYMAEELTQEIFIKLWLCRDMLHEVDNIDSYIFTIARHKTLNHLRKAAHDSKLMQEISKLVVSPESNTEERIQATDYEKMLEEALILLSPQRRLVYQLSRAEGLNHEQIADHLNLSRNTVKNHMVEALRFIRNYFKGKGAAILLVILLSA